VDAFKDVETARLFSPLQQKKKKKMK